MTIRWAIICYVRTLLIIGQFSRTMTKIATMTAEKQRIVARKWIYMYFNRTPRLDCLSGCVRPHVKSSIAWVRLIQSGYFLFIFKLYNCHDDDVVLVVTLAKFRRICNVTIAALFIHHTHTHTCTRAHMHTRTHTHKIYVYEHFFCSLVVTDSSETKQNDEKTLECGHRKDEIERQTFSHEYEALCLWPSLQLVIYAFININIFNKFPDEIRNEFHIVWTKMGRERDERFDERMGPEIITTAASAFNKWYDNCFVRAFVSSYHTHTAMYSIDYYGEKKHASKPRRALFAMPAALYSHCIGYTHSMAMNMRMTKHEWYSFQYFAFLKS